jgi:8-oxo-dGTP diphosphatase
VKLIPVALALFYRQKNEYLEVWTQVREDDGIYHGLLEFPGGKIEENETPLIAAVREVQEEVGIDINPAEGRLMGIYTNPIQNRVILLNVFLFPDQAALKGRGEWLKIDKDHLSAPFKGKIPGPNHQIIDDLFRALYS